MTTPQVLVGAEPFSHRGSLETGVLVLHGFTGNPFSVRPQAEALAAAGHHVELPRLPGHGTTVEDMITTGWGDWSSAVLDAYDVLEGRADRIVVAGLSMGGSLALSTALARPTTAGVVCINPATVPQPPDVLEMVREMLADGMAVVPGIGSDIADPDAEEIAYDGTPLRPLLSFMDEGLAVLTDRFDSLAMPLLLITSRQDHVVAPSDSDHLASSYGGEVTRVWLEHSYHVATRDHDRDVITAQMLEFVAAVGSVAPDGARRR